MVQTEKEADENLDKVKLLRTAAMSGDVKFLAKMKSEEEVDLVGVKFGGWSLLHSAVWSGQTEVVSYLMSEGLDPGEADFGGSNSLHLAARQGHLDVVHLLTSDGSCRRLLNIGGPGGSRPLHLAVRRGHTSVVVRLLEAGADAEVRDSRGRTPRDWALRQESLDILKLLSRAG